jgi:hypothetical protein
MMTTDPAGVRDREAPEDVTRVFRMGRKMTTNHHRMGRKMRCHKGIGGG